MAPPCPLRVLGSGSPWPLPATLAAASLASSALAAVHAVAAAKPAAVVTASVASSALSTALCTSARPHALWTGTGPLWTSVTPSPSLVAPPGRTRSLAHCGAAPPRHACNPRCMARPRHHRAASWESARVSAACCHRATAHRLPSPSARS